MGKIPYHFCKHGVSDGRSCGYLCLRKDYITCAHSEKQVEYVSLRLTHPDCAEFEPNPPERNNLEKIARRNS